MEDDMTEPQEIRHRPDGSIDTGFYMARGRRLRSEAAHDMAGSAVGQSRGVFAALVMLVAALPFFRGEG
jgi:hypothetical protein